MKNRDVRRDRLFAWLCLLSLGVAVTSVAFTRPEREPLRNLDRRLTGTAPLGAASPEAGAAVERLRAAVPGVRVDFAPITGAPRMVGGTAGFLTGPNGAGPAAAPGFGSEPHGPTKAFLEQNRGLFGHGPEALSAARIVRDYVTPHNGLRTMVWEQQVEGVALFGARLVSHTTAVGELVNVCSEFVPDPAGAARRGILRAGQVPGVPSVPAEVALRAAGRSLEEEIAVAEVKLVGEAGKDAERKQKLVCGALLGETLAKLTWLPMDRQTLRLCWDLTLTSRARGEMFRILVDAKRGSAAAGVFDLLPHRRELPRVHERQPLAVFARARHRP